MEESLYDQILQTVDILHEKMKIPIFISFNSNSSFFQNIFHFNMDNIGS